MRRVQIDTSKTRAGWLSDKTRTYTGKVVGTDDGLTIVRLDQPVDFFGQMKTDFCFQESSLIDLPSQPKTSQPEGKGEANPFGKLDCGNKFLTEHPEDGSLKILFDWRHVGLTHEQARYIKNAVNNHQALIDAIIDLLVTPKSPVSDCPADIAEEDCICGLHAAQNRAVNALLWAGENPPFEKKSVPETCKEGR